MSIPVNLKVLKSFDTIVDGYHSDFCSYYLVAHGLLTSFEIFYKPKRKALNEMSHILLRLHEFNRTLIRYTETLWSSIDYASSQTAKAEIKYLRAITCKLLRINNKLNIMNLSISKIWEFIYSNDQKVNSLFKLTSTRFVRYALVQDVKLFKRFLRRLIVELHLFKKQKPNSPEFRAILLSGERRNLELKSTTD